jgi:peptide/nickel transport system permease protein
VYASTLFIVANLIYFVTRFAQSGPEILDTGISLPAGVSSLIHNTASKMCLASPIYVQYGCFLRNTFASWPPYFGVSFQYFPTAASSVALDALSWSAVLMIPALVVSVGVSYVLGVSGIFEERGKNIAKVLSSRHLITPAYWIAMLMILVFAVSLKLFPAFGSYGNLGSHPNSTNQFIESAALHYVLPFTTLLFTLFGVVFRSFREGVLHIAKSDYVFASRLRGLTRSTVLSKYVMRNSMPYIFSSSVSIVGTLVSADILVEYVFGYRGVGFVLGNSLISRDYPLMGATLFFLTAFVIAILFCFDLVRYLLDPRLRAGIEENRQRSRRENYQGEYMIPSEITSHIPTTPLKDLHSVSIDVAFKILESSLKQNFPDLRDGYTWKEALQKAKEAGIQMDWKEVEATLKQYEAFRYGGEDVRDGNGKSIVELASLLYQR